MGALLILYCICYINWLIHTFYTFKVGPKWEPSYEATDLFLNLSGPRETYRRPYLPSRDRPAFVVVKGHPSPTPILDRGDAVHGMGSQFTNLG